MPLRQTEPTCGGIRRNPSPLDSDAEKPSKPSPKVMDRFGGQLSTGLGEETLHIRSLDLRHFECTEGGFDPFERPFVALTSGALEVRCDRVSPTLNQVCHGAFAVLDSWFQFIDRRDKLSCFSICLGKRHLVRTPQDFGLLDALQGPIRSGLIDSVLEFPSTSLLVGFGVLPPSSSASLHSPPPWWRLVGPNGLEFSRHGSRLGVNS